MSQTSLPQLGSGSAYATLDLHSWSSLVAHLGTPAVMWVSTLPDIAPITHYPLLRRGASSWAVLVTPYVGWPLGWLAPRWLCCSPQISLYRPQLHCGRWSLPLMQGGVTLFWVFCESGYLSFFGGEVHGELWSDKQLGTTVAPLRVGLACVVHMCT